MIKVDSIKKTTQEIILNKFVNTFINKNESIKINFNLDNLKDALEIILNCNINKTLLLDVLEDNNIETKSSYNMTYFKISTKDFYEIICLAKRMKNSKCYLKFE